MKNLPTSRVIALQRGVGLPAAIFVITLMVVIAAAINLMVEQNAETFEEEVNLTRAFYAAESGAGFAMNSLFPPEDYSAYASLPADCDSWGTRTYEFVVDGLNLCSAEVTCDGKTLDGVVYSTIESTGTCNEVSRTIQVRTVYDEP
ncbi:MAG: hypothetical protein RLZZ385_2548 [Pseudomonadota bacterium]|jgi:MSHA biogenesis protein MshP